MNGIHRDQDHKYYKDGNGPLPSITTCIAQKDKGWALSNWQMTRTAMAAIVNVSDWQPHLEHATVIPTCAICMAGWKKDTTPADRAARWLTKWPGFESQVKMDLGSAVHAIAESVARGEKLDLTGVDDEAIPFVESWIRDFVEGGRTPGKAKPQFHPAYLEYVVYREGDEQCLPYGGTMDVACRIGDEVYIADYKTGAGVYDETRLQLAAGWFATEAGQLCVGCIDDHFKHRPSKTYRPPQVTKAAVIHVRPERTEFIVKDVRPSDFEAFAATRTLFAWTQQMKEKAA